ncbi:hypothetical protein [Campylobacter sp. RM16190]|uniref:hypothetical protein n=1 Tax=Campylobacter sp. RM16190 TaxID=1705727 RepID=UPI0014765965|nr:hypothetical protein [Campylobacter sp. RM16190]
MDKAKKIQDFYANKVKDACRPEIRRYGALQLAVFKAKRAGEDISALKQELENARREAMRKAIACLDEHEHFEVIATLSDNGKIRSMPDFFKNCII